MNLIEVRGAESLHPKLVRALETPQWDDLSLEELGVCQAIMGLGSGAVFHVGSGMRSVDEQAVLYSQGRWLEGYPDRRAQSVVTNAGPYQSMHNYGIAADLVPASWTYLHRSGAWFLRSGPADSVREAWEKTGIPRLLESAGLVWGGKFVSLFDPEHFQTSSGLGAFVPASGDGVGVWWNAVWSSWISPAYHPSGVQWHREHPDVDPNSVDRRTVIERLEDLIIQDQTVELSEEIRTKGWWVLLAALALLLGKIDSGGK